MIGSYFLGIQQIITHEEHFWYSFSSKLPQKPWHHGHSNRKWLKQLQSHFHWPVSIAKPKVTTFCCFYLFSVQQRPPTPDISSSSKNINSLAYLPDYLSVSYEYATGNFNMPILYALEVLLSPLWQHFTNKFIQVLCWIQFVLFFPSVNTVKHRKWNFVQIYFTSWKLQLFN